MDNVHRLAWFVAYTQEAVFADSAMFNTQGELLPIARALFADLDHTEVNCTDEPRAMHVPTNF